MKARGVVDPVPVSQLLRCLSDSPEPTTDWNEVVAAAACHGLAPLLFRRLKKSDARACVPADAWERLRLAYLDSAGRNMRLYRGLGPVLRCLRSSGIKLIVLKGAFLAEAVYGDVALRPMSDVDLMVPRAELQRVQAVLLDLGCGPRERKEIESVCRIYKDLEHFHKNGLDLEVHWTIVTPIGPVRVDTADLWDRARPVTTAGVEVLALSPEDLLLHLCLHFGYEHRFVGLRSFYDIAETVHRFRDEMDWVRVVHTAREWHASRYVGLTLHLAQNMLGARIPGDVLERLVPGGPDRRVLGTARELVLAGTGYSRRLQPLFDVVDAKSIGDRAKLSWGRVFLSRDEMAARYPASRGTKHLGFYYALRLRDLVRFYGDYNLKRCRLMLRSLRRGREAPLVNWLRSGKFR